MCNMLRIFLNCFLVASIVYAEPVFRNRRHLSYIKDFIASTLFGWKQPLEVPFPNIETDNEYQFYKVPGYDDLLIKARSNLPVVRERSDQQGEEMEINPFESYIGTKNSKDTLLAFQNVNNLLSTRILNGQETNLLKKTMVPMISGLGTVKFVTDNVRPVPLIAEVEQPVIVQPAEVQVKFEHKPEPRYIYRQVESHEPALMYPSPRNVQTSVGERFDRTSTLPLCIQQRINDVISLGVNPYRMPKFRELIKYPYVFNRFPSSRFGDSLTVGYDAEKIIVPLSHSQLPIKHLHELGHTSMVSVDSSKTNNAKVPTYNPVGIIQTLGPMPPQYTSKIHSKFTKVKGSHFSYAQVSHNNPGGFSLAKEKDDVNPKVVNENPFHNQQVYIPPHSHIETVITSGANKTKDTDVSIKKYETNGFKPSGNTSKNEAVSQYTYTQIKHHKPNGVTKENEKVKTNSPSSSSNSKVSSVTNPVIVNNAKDAAKVKNTNNKKEHLLNIVKPTDTSTEKETLAEYIYEREIQAIPKPFILAKEKDEDDNNAYTNSSTPNSYVYIPLKINAGSGQKHNSNIVKTTEKIPEKGTLAYYIFKRIGHTHPPFSAFKDEDEPKTAHKATSTSNHYVFIPPIDLGTNMDTESPPTTVQDKSTTKAINNGLKDGDSPHYIDKQIGNNKSKVLDVTTEANKLQTNAYTNSSVTTTITEPTAINDDELFTNKVTESLESTSTIENITTENNISKSDTTISFKDSPIVVAVINNDYHQNNMDENPMKIKGNNDGITKHVLDNFIKGRGDIPDQ